VLTAARGAARAGLWGAILLTVPTLAVMFGFLYAVSGHLLPLRSPDQRRDAFKCLLSAILGTNRPYYLVHSDQWGPNKVERLREMGGRAFGRLFAGPGVVITRCDHIPVISDGVHFKGIRPPGVSFLHYAEAVPQAIDLREQLRAFEVEARTKDGIDVKVRAFTPFRLDCGEQRPELGNPFPFRARSAFLALHRGQFVEHKDRGQTPERTEIRYWDEIPCLFGTRILRDIIAEYRFDDLCAPYRLSDDPRSRIAEDFRRRLKATLLDYGIQLLGGGIGNLLPAEERRREIFEQRIRAWQAHWVRRVMQQQAEGQRSRMRQIEKARAQAQVEAIQAISERLARLKEARGLVSPEEIVDLFIEVIQEMATRPLARRLLPSAALKPLETARERVGLGGGGRPPGENAGGA